jgi:hypothetical protein
MRIPDEFAARLLNSLRPREREILGLRCLEQFGIPDIAHMLNMKPGTVSGHLSKGLEAVARVVDDSREAAGKLLDDMGETLASRRPRQVVTLMDETATSVAVLPFRQIMGAAVRADKHLSRDVLRYFITEINGKPVSVAEAEAWVLNAPISLGLPIKRALLSVKGIKTEAKFDSELATYFFPVGFAGVELYYERDFDHCPLTLPLPPGRTIMNHFPPVPAQRDQRTRWVPSVWPLRVVDLGEYAKDYDEQMANDAENALRSRRRHIG